MDNIMKKKQAEDEEMESFIKESIAETCAPFHAMAKKHSNTCMPIFNKRGKQMGVIEEGDDGFVQFVIYGRKSGHKFWVYPSHDASKRITVEYATLKKDYNPVWV